MVDLATLMSGTYEAKRAAALSGVPLSTVYNWARTDFVVPSVSRTREKLWSYADLMALRIAYWLRHPGEIEDRQPSPLPTVREALASVVERGLPIWSYEGGRHDSAILVDRDGKIWIRDDGELLHADGQRGLENVLNLLGPFASDGYVEGPDLLRPRPHLRIIPGRVSGEPHLEHSRISTLTLVALANRGLTIDQIASLYPDQRTDAIEEAVELERSLAIRPAAA